MMSLAVKVAAIQYAYNMCMTYPPRKAFAFTNNLIENLVL